MDAQCRGSAALPPGCHRNQKVRYHFPREKSGTTQKESARAHSTLLVTNVIELLTPLV